MLHVTKLIEDISGRLFTLRNLFHRNKSSLQHKWPIYLKRCWTNISQIRRASLLRHEEEGNFSLVAVVRSSSCFHLRNTVRAAKCKWNLLIEFRRREGGCSASQREGRVRGGGKGLASKSIWRIDGFPRSACHSRIIVTGGTKRMRGASSIFHHVYAHESRVPLQMETNLYTTRKKKRSGGRFGDKSNRTIVLFLFIFYFSFFFFGSGSDNIFHAWIISDSLVYFRFHPFHPWKSWMVAECFFSLLSIFLR